MDELKVKMNMTLTGVKLKKADESNVVVTTFEAKVTREEASTFLGSDFSKIAFGDLVIEKMEDSGEDMPVWTVKKHVLDLELGTHRLRMLGHPERACKPRLGSISPVKGERAVVFTVSVQFSAAELGREAIGELVEKFDTQFAVEFLPSQQQLPLDAGDDDEAHDGNQDDGETPHVEAPGKKRGKMLVVKDASAEQH